MNGAKMIDWVHVAMIVSCLSSYTFLHFTGHADPQTSEALLSLAAFFGGSYARSKNPGG
jgi:NO-binding membrane sensor protein with MHYT domain